jgi:FdhD protein
MSDPTADASLVRYKGATAQAGSDRVAREEPLELRLNGTPLSVLMRTPGDDEDLAFGYLLTERVLADPADITAIRHCTVLPAGVAEDNVLLVTLRPGVEIDFERLRRNLYANASCGLCGKATIENVLATAPPLKDDLVVPASVLYSLPARLRQAQRSFEETGGLHAAGLFDAAGRLLAIREDVGRHNAVDKVIGRAVRNGDFPLSGRLLMVSGRASFEIVQKAAAARIPLVAAVSAPSSLAIDLAQATGITLIGFLRGEAMNVYTGVERIDARVGPGRSGAPLL